MNAGLNGLTSQLPSQASELPAVHCVAGREPVLQMSHKLAEFSARCGQPGAMEDISYFLSKPGFLPRIPYLLLVTRSPKLDLQSPKLEDLLGTLLIFEQKISGYGAGAFATNDRSGRSTLVAEPSERARIAALSSRALLNRGAHLILMSFRTADEGEIVGAVQHPLLEVAEGDGVVARWAQRERSIPGYLPLLESYDATLAKIGQRTRSNLRYYRRRAEIDLGCVFLPRAEASREEVLAFNSKSMYAVPPEVIGWRYDALRDLAEPVFMGIKDRDGRWLSMIGGRRYLDRSELLWQLNRKGLEANSLGTVMRSYFIEHEIAHGSRRMYIEGGTPHPIRFSFVPERLTDLAVLRRSLTARAMQMVARRMISKDNELSHMLSAKDLTWRSC